MWNVLILMLNASVEQRLRRVLSSIKKCNCSAVQSGYSVKIKHLTVSERLLFCLTKMIKDYIAACVNPLTRQ